MLRRLNLAAMLAAFVLPLATAAPAAASAPIVNEHERFTETFPDKVCGFSGTSTITVVDNFKLYADGTFTDTSAFNLIFTAQNGNSVMVSSAGQVTGLDQPIVNPDGTLTFINTFKGLPERLSIPGGPTLSLDAGVVTFATTFSVDENGDLVFISEDVSGLHGPHPDVLSDFELFCEVIVPALTG
jgi:hypothetical protein